MPMIKMWRSSKRELDCTERPLVMGILNVTPDSFSDGGVFFKPEDALRRAAVMISEGADILDIGGESTRPNSVQISPDEEIERVVPVITAISQRYDIPISIDTTKSAVAREAVSAGAEIINDISGLRFDPQIARIAAETGSGLVLMHSRGPFESMHSMPQVPNIIEDVCRDLTRSTSEAGAAGVQPDSIAIDIGIGFGKTMDQNLELLAKLDQIALKFPQFPILAGTSRKSFIGKILGDAPVDERLAGSLATAAVAVWNGARMIRTHDVKATVETLRVVEAIRRSRNVCDSQSSSM